MFKLIKKIKRKCNLKGQEQLMFHLFHTLQINANLFQENSAVKVELFDLYNHMEIIHSCFIEILNTHEDFL